MELVGVRFLGLRFRQSSARVSHHTGFFVSEGLWCGAGAGQWATNQGWAISTMISLRLNIGGVHGGS